jgi:hypothetical protein
VIEQLAIGLTRAHLLAPADLWRRGDDDVGPLQAVAADELVRFQSGSGTLAVVHAAEHSEQFYEALKRVGAEPIHGRYFPDAPRS